MSELPLTLVGGYLGSGKTTWIDARLRAEDGVRYAVLVNDFGALNIDATLIARRGAQTVELTNGCVCCSISGDLAAAVETVAARADVLDWVLFEASGVADAARLQQQARNWPGVRLESSVTLADALRIRTLVEDKFVGAHLRSQLVLADEVRFSRLDRIDARTRRALEVWLEGVRGQPARARPALPAFRSDRVDGMRFADRSSLGQWLGEQAPGTQRIKGFVRFSEDPASVHLLQWVRGEWTLEPFTSAAPPVPELVRIALA